MAVWLYGSVTVWLIFKVISHLTISNISFSVFHNVSRLHNVSCFGFSKTWSEIVQKYVLKSLKAHIRLRP